MRVYVLSGPQYLFLVFPSFATNATSVFCRKSPVIRLCRLPVGGPMITGSEGMYEEK